MLLNLLARINMPEIRSIDRQGCLEKEHGEKGQAEKGKERKTHFCLPMCGGTEH
jgi:hypothetical protein